MKNKSVAKCVPSLETDYRGEKARALLCPPDGGFRVMALYPHISAARNRFLFFSEINMAPFYRQEDGN
ncbi:hypothetical protein [Dickeya chrysanthemi]|uniref:hypothetical protein n=1 Tax=Dickeya chrysanthemi TaxID=556 RepID=UPI0012E06063|nr:hypothetical protein [Dickeya chrysanthemi]